jgi:hypothetical protein
LQKFFKEILFSRWTFIVTMTTDSFPALRDPNQSVRFSESGRSACQLPVSRNVKRSLQIARVVSGESYTTDKAGGFNSAHQGRKFILTPPPCPTPQLATHSAITILPG